MKKKLIINTPSILFVIALILFFSYMIGTALDNWANDNAQGNNDTLEMQEYHSQDGSLVVEIDGYIKVIKP